MNYVSAEAFAPIVLLSLQEDQVVGAPQAASADRGTSGAPLFYYRTGESRDIAEHRSATSAARTILRCGCERREKILQGNPRKKSLAPR